MGINGLSRYLRQLEPDIFVEVPLNSFFGERIAIDASVYMYKYKCTDAQLRGNWYDRWITLVITLWKHNIRPIVIFDGTPPIEKLETQTARREIRAVKQERLDALRECIDDEGVVDKNRTAEWYNYEEMRETDDSNLRAIINETTMKLDSQCIHILPEDIQLLKSLLDALGITWYVANGEAERTCAWLCTRGHVRAVLTTDSDVLAYGAPIFINDINTYESICTMIAYSEVLSLLSFTQAQFLDFCIMLGTDYNKRLYKIGPAKSHGLLATWGNASDIPDFDLETLKYHRTLELLTLSDSPESVLLSSGSKFSIPPLGKLDPLALELLLIKYNSAHSLETIRGHVYTPQFKVVAHI